jgi:hypothetical protein
VRVLVGCEFSGVVRDAFTRLGHEAMSVDLLATESPGNHLVGDIRDCLDMGWDMAIMFPPCQYLARSGASWHAGTIRQAEALTFVQVLMDAPIPRIAIENPIGAINSRIRKPDQIVQPWWFGDGYTKSTCLWLKDLPLLKPTKLVPVTMPGHIYMMSKTDRAKNRSRTPRGLADAMASQWGRS